MSPTKQNQNFHSPQTNSSMKHQNKFNRDTTLNQNQKNKKVFHPKTTCNSISITPNYLESATAVQLLHPDVHQRPYPLFFIYKSKGISSIKSYTNIDIVSVLIQIPFSQESTYFLTFLSSLALTWSSFLSFSKQ